MCGQGGVAGSISIDAEKAFQHLLIYNGVRGTDSTGAASVKRHEISGRPQIVVAKEIGTAYDLFSITRKHPYKDLSHVLAGQHRALLGHCRSQTRGSVSRFNAHPFEFENVVGTHNGTISYTSESSLGTDYSKMQTDSEKIFASINDQGIAETMKHLAEAPTDAYALVWYDVRDNTLNFLRNKARPLYYGFDKDNKMLFWSSEFYHVASAMSVGTIPLKEKGGYIHELPVDSHYSWVIPEQNGSFGKAHVVKREGRKPAPLNQTKAKYYVVGGTRDGTISNGGTITDSESSNLEDYANRNFTGGMPVWDKHGYIWKKWSSVHTFYTYAWERNGPWYTSPQKAWDALLLADKIARYRFNQYPGGIIIDEEVIEKSRKQIIESPKTENEKSIKTMIDAFKDKKFKECIENKGGESRVNVIFRDTNRKVLWDNKDKTYSVFTWLGAQGGNKWQEATTKTCPSFVPFTDLDVSARHQFVTLGKKKNKVRAFRGFQGTPILQSKFEELMGDGCVNCQRVPQWGNDVHFITKEHFFCEHCARDKEMVDEYKQMNKAG